MLRAAVIALPLLLSEPVPLARRPSAWRLLLAKVDRECGDA